MVSAIIIRSFRVRRDRDHMDQPWHLENSLEPITWRELEMVSFHLFAQFSRAKLDFIRAYVCTGHCTVIYTSYSVIYHVHDTKFSLPVHLTPFSIFYSPQGSKLSSGWLDFCHLTCPGAVLCCNLAQIVSITLHL